MRITFEVPDYIAPALRSAVDEISQELGGRVEGRFSYATEQAFTDALIGLGALRAAVNAHVKEGSIAYRTRQQARSVNEPVAD